MKRTVVFFLMGALLVGCARSVTTGGGPDYPAGADELVVRVETRGGFVPIEFNYRRVPEFSLMGDGTIVTVGPQIAIYPPPALPSLVSTRLRAAGIEAILREAENAGVMEGDKDFTNDRVADAPTTVIIVIADGRTHTTSVYALGFEGQPEEVNRIEKFINDLQSLNSGPDGAPSWMPDDAYDSGETQYEISRLQVITLKPTERDDDIDPGTATWPLATPLSQVGTPFDGDSRCAVFEGEEVDQLLAEFGKTNQLTRWNSEGELYELAIRPLLPDETGC